MQKMLLSLQTEERSILSQCLVKCSQSHKQHCAPSCVKCPTASAVKHHTYINQCRLLDTLAAAAADQSHKSCSLARLEYFS